MDKAAFYDALRKSGMFPRGLPQSVVDGCEAILSASERLPVEYRAYLLGTSYHETAHTMAPITEYGPVSYFDKYEPGTRIGKVLGNTQRGDGYRFRGHGFVQLTGRANFAKASKAVGVDLVAAPHKALYPDIAAQILVRGCVNGWFTGKRLGDYLPGDYRSARRVVNGMDRADLIAGYARLFEVALREIPDSQPVKPAKGGGGLAVAIVAAIAAAAAYFFDLF